MTDNLSPTKRALLALKQMQAKLEALENAKSEEIAIIGMGCRFPGGVNSPESFWQLLCSGTDAITEVPPQHWQIDSYYPKQICSRKGGFVPNLKEFDAQFFRIAPREAISLDPQQRLLLEVSWEALENAAIAPDSLSGSATGVFIGICSIDYWHQLLSRNNTEIDAYLTTGNTHSVAAGRLSYTLGLTGPAIAVDTACSSSLVAVHLACQSLRNRECDLALAGGVNRLISPEISINFSQAKMLSPTGFCHSFDAKADGFVRSEGCGVIVLKRLSDAISSGDQILAVISGSAVNQDGRTSGLTAPNGLSQQAVIRQALAKSQIEPSQIDYLETHGTGTALGDPIEVNALGEVFNKREKPLILGSVKTNIGHTEAAAGIASLIKVVLSFQQQKIPANLHFQQPNHQINWHELPIQVATEMMPWLNTNKPRMAGVSAFGFSGTNAHVVIQESVNRSRDVTCYVSTKGESQKALCQLFVLSAKSDRALKDLVQRYLEFFKSNHDLSLEDVCFTASVGRSHFNHRLAVMAISIQELERKLTAFLREELQSGVWSGKFTKKVDNNVIKLNPIEFTTEASLVEIAQLYVSGKTLDWFSFYQNSDYSKVALPTYPFQRQTYWYQ
ncbi:6-deoxyerythronolide-B synthase [Stanieria cyanosphaera PCC 7437]|uniref:6-deoxyerythronolide-B synthase n=1 Tax=Stanieria cyanosphaera (strain ATCC 29371 / PCC 7437) TaxID=111780 RepID=K9XTR6_STAC7|nr:polyketide synthase [Stanieria cyanosphaera]AFZ35459.1 6-deoxyerythronolide-B synthase [Stanieria cyanosphaera PCC 7437]